MVHQPRAKNWCWTLNNYTQEELQSIRSLRDTSDQVEYVCFGKEVGEQGTPHLQGFITFGISKRLSALKSLLGNRVHGEVARGKPQQAIEYCEKDGDFEEFGDRPVGQGARNDLVAFCEKLKSCRRMREVADEFPTQVLKYSKSAIYLKSLYADKSVRQQPDVRVYWGSTGTGKTRRAIEEASSDNQDYWRYPGDGWFDGYDGEENVVFDEFTGGEFKLSYLLQLTDRYPMKVKVKGSYTWWSPKIIWFTSNLSPDEWYPNAHEEHKAALRRRLTTVVHFNQPLQ